jgi:hypothetical protein
LGDQTSAQELALAKALKSSKKFNSGSLGLSLTEKASATKGGILKGKMSLPRTSVSEAGATLKVLDLFGYVSSTSEGEVAAPTPVPRRKRPQKSPLKIAWKTSDVAPAKGTFVWMCSISLFYVRYI